MAAVRHIPRPETAGLTVTFVWNGSILTNNAPAKIVAVGSDVTFVNSSSSVAAITINFAPNPPGVSNPPGPPLFTQNTITIQPGQNSGALALPANTNGAVNYTVSVNGNQEGGPYAIQAGTGPLYVQITNFTPNPGEAAVPATVSSSQQGMLEMYSTDQTSYTIKWPAMNPFPGLTAAYKPLSSNIPYAQSGPATTYTYEIPSSGAPAEGGADKDTADKVRSIQSSTPPRLGTAGGGKVVVQ
jgi:hypothetical protein